MKFSVLMSVYFKEHADYLDKALKSVLINQTLKPAELILVADGQLTDELYLTIDKYKALFCNINLIQLPYNVGLGRALNEGLKHCSYEWIARMDSDDISLPYRFEKQFNYIEQNTNIGVLGSWISEFNNDLNNTQTVKKVPEKHNEILLYAQSRNPINHPVVIFNKQKVLDVGGYEHCPMFEDYWLWVRLLQAGTQFYNIQEPLLLFRANNSMYERRGGISYIEYEYRFLRKIYRVKFISSISLIKNIIIRTMFRVLPNKLRTLMYKTILRNK